MMPSATLNPWYPPSKKSPQYSSRVWHLAEMQHALEAIEPAALDLIEQTIECRLVLARARQHSEAAEMTPAPGGRPAPLRMALAICEAPALQYVLTDHAIAAIRKRAAAHD